MSPTKKVRCPLPQDWQRGERKVPLCSWSGNGVPLRRKAASVRTSTGDRRRLCRISFQWSVTSFPSPHRGNQGKGQFMPFACPYYMGFLPRQGRVVFSPLRSENLHPTLDTALVRRENGLCKCAGFEQGKAEDHRVSRNREDCAV